MNIRTKSDGTAISHPSPQGRGTDAEVIVDNENVQSVTSVTRKNNTTATITTENGRFDIETQCIASLLDLELRFACKGLFTFNADGVPVRRLFADDVFANIRKFRRNDMPVEGSTTIDIDSTSPERATSIAQWQRPVNAWTINVESTSPEMATSIAQWQRPVNTSPTIKKFRRNGMSVANNRKQSENSVRNDMLKKIII